jgi:P pilus assembly chaperone PapD
MRTAPSPREAWLRQWLRRLPLLVVLLCVLLRPLAVAAQAILVAPQSVVLKSRDRTGTVELYNPSARAAEVSIRAVYGHPTTTPDGDLTLVVIEQPDAAAPSAAGFVEAFPRRLVLQPNQRQTVRLLARPPAGLAEGEYWARLVIAAKDAEAPAAPTDSTGVSVGLTLEVRTIIAVNYRNGAQRTGVQLGALTAQAQGDSLVVRAPMQRTGTAAWIGMTSVKLLDARGAVLASQSLQTAVYQSISPRFSFDRRGLAPGTYRISVDMSTDRPDVTQSTLLRAPPQHAETTVVIPNSGG